MKDIETKALALTTALLQGHGPPLSSGPNAEPHLETAAHNAVLLYNKVLTYFDTIGATPTD